MPSECSTALLVVLLVSIVYSDYRYVPLHLFSLKTQQYCRCQFLQKKTLSHNKYHIYFEVNNKSSTEKTRFQNLVVVGTQHCSIAKGKKNSICLEVAQEANKLNNSSSSNSK